MAGTKEKTRGGRVTFHKSALLQETIELLNPKKDGLYIDATIGGAGHAKAILEKGAKVLGIDQDPEAVEYAKSLNLKGLKIVKGNFSQIGEIARREGFEKVDGIIFDLGVSSHQLDKPERGFSFQRSGPLDMRMDPDLNIRAYDIINNFEERRLYEIFKTYGQEKFSKRLANAIISARKVKTIETTKDLAQIIENAVPRGVNRGKIHSATKVFQALRIVINSEILNLEQALPQTLELLKPGGRLAIISFHSLEDSLVKRFFKQETKLEILTKKPIGPSVRETEENRRARSSKLRVAEKI